VAARKAPRASGPKAFLILGEDSYLRETHRERIITETVPEEARAFTVARYSLARTPLADVLAQANVRPMLAPRQVVLVSEADELGEDDVEALKNYFAAPADFTVLVFEAAQLDRRTSGAKLLLEECELLSADSNDADAGAAVSRFAREFGLTMPRDAADDLVFALGADQGRLRGELAKLRAYAGAKREVTSEDVAVLVEPARKFSVFLLADLLVERKRAEALALLRRLLDGGESPFGVVGLLAWIYRQLWIARSLPVGTPLGKAQQVLRAPAGRVDGLLRQARRFAPEQLRRAFVVLLEADVRLKSSSPNPAAVLEALVVELTAAPRRARRLAPAR